MTAIACLKVFVGDELRFADNDTMATLVGKVAGAYLETTWLWPRRYGLVAPFSFVLADPRATQLDARELQALARDLQFKLFGDKGVGDIALLMFEGDQTDVMRFAGIHGAQLKALLNGEDDGSLVGRVCRITPTEVSSVAPRGGPVCGIPPMEELAPVEQAPAPARVGYRGVYHTAREVFIGSVAVWRQDGVSDVFGLTPSRADADRQEDDIPTLLGAKTALAKLEAGLMFLPISFSAMVKPSARAELLPHLEALPRALRGRLAVAVYDTPRAPSFSALSQVKRFLDPFFGRLDLRVSDPAFQIDDLPADLASSVTLVLPQASEKARLAAVTRFMREGPAYRRKHVWQGLADVRTRRELNHCIDQEAPFLTGAAVTDLLEAPVGSASLPSLHLPMHDWSTFPDNGPMSSVA
jgi:hypothetical protein